MGVAAAIISNMEGKKEKKNPKIYFWKILLYVIISSFFSRDLQDNPEGLLFKVL